MTSRMPEGAARKVVVDTTPIIALASIQHLDVLTDLYGEILIPPTVKAELLTGSRAGRAELLNVDWIRERELLDPFKPLLLTDLGGGEAEVLVLAEELKADLVIIDELQARRYARYLRLPLTGTLGVLLRAKNEGLIEEIATLIDRLKRNGIRLADALIEEVLRTAGER